MTEHEKSMLLMLSNIIENIVENNEFSEKVLQVQENDPWFLDVANFIGLVFELNTLKLTLRNMVKYAGMSEKRTNEE